MGTQGKDQKTAVSSVVPRKYGEMVVGAVPKASQTISQPVKHSADESTIPSHADPTRFGDWEFAGRYMDFLQSITLD